MERAAAWLAAMAAAAAGVWAAEGNLSLTVYNGDFACVREARVLELAEGTNAVRLTGMPGTMDADSVVLRGTGEEPSGPEILEQRYVNEPLTEERWLRVLEGTEVRFRVPEGERVHAETGTVVRGPGNGEPIVRMADGVRFGLPGEPVFGGLDAEAYLKPSLEWVLRSDRAGNVPVEVAYLADGLSWEASYNLVAPEEGGDEYALSGWVAIRNDSGKDYPDAGIKLVAGDVARLEQYREELVACDMDPPDCELEEALPEERAFDEFHLYTLPRRTTLADGELKQIEFLRADGVKGTRTYVYEPLRGWRGEYGSRRADAGLNDERKVAVFIEIRNSAENGLGVPLPKGRMRLYRRDAEDGRPEFTGEGAIDHMPKDETVRLETGYAFDLAAERRQTDFSILLGEAFERFEIRVRNHKAQAVDVRLVEHLWRWGNWEIAEENAPHEKTASDRAEWTLAVPAGGEAVLDYTVRYWW